MPPRRLITKGDICHVSCIVHDGGRLWSRTSEVALGMSAKVVNLDYHRGEFHGRRRGMCTPVRHGGNEPETRITGYG